MKDSSKNYIKILNAAYNDKDDDDEKDVDEIKVLSEKLSKIKK
jgi:hypothetical protein